MNPLSNIEDRAHRLLKSLVESYIDDGQPVASRRLASLPGINVSSATVRNIMADLESRGLVMSPHTSAGKVPTQAGLRLFVDSLLSVEPLTAEAVAMFRNQLNPDRSPQELIEAASRLLAHVTQMAGLVTLPRREVPSLRHVEFLPLPGQRVLVILVVNEKDVQNRVIHTERDYAESELLQAANYINREFAGQPLALVRSALLESLQQSRSNDRQVVFQPQRAGELQRQREQLARRRRHLVGGIAFVAAAVIALPGAWQTMAHAPLASWLLAAVGISLLWPRNR